MKLTTPTTAPTVRSLVQHPLINGVIVTKAGDPPKFEGAWVGKPISLACWRQIVSFFKRYPSDEVQVRLYYNSDPAATDPWIAHAHPQRGVGMTTREDPSLPEHGTPPATGPNLMCVGTVHSHCRAGAFQSGTDHSDEIRQDGIHLTIGHVDKQRIDIHWRAYFQEFPFELSLNEVFDIRESEPPVIPDNFKSDEITRLLKKRALEISAEAFYVTEPVEFPDCWNQNVVFGHSGNGFAHGSVGGSSDYNFNERGWRGYLPGGNAAGKYSRGKSMLNGMSQLSKDHFAELCSLVIDNSMVTAFTNFLSHVLNATNRVHVGPNQGNEVFTEMLEDMCHVDCDLVLKRWREGSADPVADRHNPNTPEVTKTQADDSENRKVFLASSGRITQRSLWWSMAHHHLITNSDKRAIFLIDRLFPDERFIIDLWVALVTCEMDIDEAVEVTNHYGANTGIIDNRFDQYKIEIEALLACMDKDIWSEDQFKSELARARGREALQAMDESKQTEIMLGEGGVVTSVRSHDAGHNGVYNVD